MDGHIQTSVEGIGPVTEREVTTSVDYLAKAVSETAETTRVETRWIRAILTTKANGETHTHELPAARAVVDIDRRKRVVEVVETSFAGEPDLPELMAAGPKTWTNLFARFGVFPEGDVEVGASWSEELSVPVAPGGPEVEIAVASRLLALTTFQSRKCAKIRTSFEVPVSLDLSDFGAAAQEAEGGRLEAAFQGDVLWYYDYENSVDVYQEASARMEADLSMSGPGTPGGTITTEARLDLKLTLAE